MFPYSMVILVLWTLFLLLFWMLGIPLGVAASYAYPWRTPFVRRSTIPILR